jgi:Flp pilus assembly protein TadG
MNVNAVGMERPGAEMEISGRFRRVRERGPQSGISVIEVVLLTPLVVGFLMFLVCFGVLVDAHGTVQGAARDAARMGSLQRDYASANRAAVAAAAADLGNSCANANTVQQVNPVNKAPYNGFAAGELYTIKVTCVVPLTGLDWFNLGSQTVIAYSTAPLDVFRRTG